MAKRPAEPKPRDWPGVRVLRGVMRANGALRDRHKDHFKHQAVGMTEFDFLAALGNTAGLRMGELAHAMITTPSNVTRVCTEMEARGLAVRERSASSDREVIARLTPRGQATFEAMFMPTARFSQGLVDAALSEAEQRQLGALLDRLLAGLTTR